MQEEKETQTEEIAGVQCPIDPQSLVECESCQ